MSVFRTILVVTLITLSLTLSACRTPIVPEPIAATPIEFGTNERPIIERVYILTDASGDLLESPSVFGTYDHALMASEFLGYVPTQLDVEVLAAFSVQSANETERVG